MIDSERFTLAAVSRLLEYPDDNLYADIPALAEEAQDILKDNAEILKAFEDFFAYLHNSGKRSAQEKYVTAFDHTPAASMYMTWHRYGDDRSQGRAMAALNGLYRTAGFEPVPGIMPDYLPRMLEFLSVCEDWAAEALLDGFGPEIQGVVTELQKHMPEYAQLIGAAIAPLQKELPGHFKPRTGPDPTARPMAMAKNLYGRENF